MLVTSIRFGLYWLGAPFENKVELSSSSSLMVSSYLIFYFNRYNIYKPYCLLIFRIILSILYGARQTGYGAIRRTCSKKKENIGLIFHWVGLITIFVLIVWWNNLYHRSQKTHIRESWKWSLSESNCVRFWTCKSRAVRTTF